MGFYDLLAKWTNGMNNLRRIFLVIIVIGLLPILTTPINFQNGLLKVANTPLPMFVSYTWGLVYFVIAIVGLVGFWRRKL